MIKSIDLWFPIRGNEIRHTEKKPTITSVKKIALSIFKSSNLSLTLNVTTIHKKYVIAVAIAAPFKPYFGTKIKLRTIPKTAAKVAIIKLKYVFSLFQIPIEQIR